MLHASGLPQTRNRQSAGFTLLELSVVLVIIAVVTGMAVTSGVGAMKTARLSSTQQKMAAIEKALQSYRAANDRLPCPADLTIAEGVANFGVEAATAGTCTGGTPAANNSAAGATNTGKTGVEGALPVVTLGLPNDYMYDGWGRRFRYAVDKSATAVAGMTSIKTQCTNLSVTIKDATSGNTITSGALYALISHGENGHGGYTKKGVISSTGSTNTDEQTNCHCTSAAVAGTYAPTYIQRDPYTNPSTATDAYDDIVTYKERWQMLVAWEKSQSCTGPQYAYIMDSNNNRIKVYDMDGNYQRSIGSDVMFPTGNQRKGLDFDSAGNLWVGDGDGGRALKLNPTTGALLATITTPGYGTCGEVVGIAIDSQDNVWLSCYYDAVVLKYSSSGVYLAQAGCAGTPGPNGCPDATGDGELYNPRGIAVDDDDNLYVIDSNNNRVQKFNSSGSFLAKHAVLYDSSDVQVHDGYVYVDNMESIEKFDLGLTTRLATLCSYGNGPTQFYYSYGFALDRDGNIWVGNTVSQYVQKVNPTCTAMEFQLGCASGDCSSGSDDDSFNFPTGIAIY